jgi:hypothetical protein
MTELLIAAARLFHRAVVAGNVGCAGSGGGEMPVWNFDVVVFGVSFAGSVTPFTVSMKTEYVVI